MAMFIPNSRVGVCFKHNNSYCYFTQKLQIYKIYFDSKTLYNTKERLYAIFLKT